MKKTKRRKNTMLDDQEFTPKTVSEEAEGQQGLFEKLHEGNVTADVSGEYILPDYLPPVEKILRLRAAPRLAGKYMNGDKVAMEGSIDWEVLYLTDTGDIHTFSTEERFSESCSIHHLDPACIVWVQPVVEKPVCRLTSPRKMSLRCQCNIALTPVTPRTVAPKIVTRNEIVPGEEDLRCVQTQSAPVCSSAFWALEDIGIRCSEDMELNGGVLDSIVSSTCSAILTDAKISDGNLEYRCDVYFDVLCRLAGEDEPRFETVQHHFPISRTVPAPQVPQGAFCYGECEIRELQIQPGSDRMGELKRIELDYVVDCNFTVCQNVKNKVVRDAFSTACPSETQSGNCRTLKHRKTDRVNFTVSGMIPVSEDVPGKIIDMHASVEQAEVRSEKNRFSISGTVALTAILYDQNMAHIFSVTGSVPFQFESPCDGFMGDMDQRLCCTVTDLRGRTDGGQIRCDMEVHLCFQILEKINMPFLSAVVLDTDQPYARGQEQGMILCYPRAGETVWEIAKRYRVTPEAVRAANSIDLSAADAVPGERVLAIEPE